MFETFKVLSTESIDRSVVFVLNVEGTESFEYDAIGNLTKQTKNPNPQVPDQITELKWNAYGKVSQVVKNDVTMTFGYDAQQNRLKKEVMMV